MKTKNNLSETIFNYDKVQDFHWYEVDFNKKVPKNLLPFRSVLENYFNCLPDGKPCQLCGYDLKYLYVNLLGRYRHHTLMLPSEPRKNDKDILMLAIKKGLIKQLKTSDYVFR